MTILFLYCECYSKATKSHLEGIAVGNSHHPYDDSSSSFLVLLDVELAAAEAEHIWCIPCQHVWKDLLVKSSLGVGAIFTAIDEHILFTAVTMQVAIENDLTIFHQPNSKKIEIYSTNKYNQLNKLEESDLGGAVE